MNIEAMMAMRRVVVFIMIAVVGKKRFKNSRNDIVTRTKGEQNMRYRLVPELYTNKIPEVWVTKTSLRIV